MKATVKQIFNKIQGLNPTTSTVSSIGTFVTNQAQQVSDMILRETISFLPKKSLAYKIATSANKFTDKQLWVIAFELEKNAEYSEILGSELERIKRVEKRKIEESKAKLSENKENSQNVLDFVKSNGKKLTDYYEFVKKNKKYAKEFYSKKFTMTSANEFCSK
ncbi:MAG: hypothetical protein FWF72_01720 [Paludibacter sp.]|nr:hypothetical protein [Paludibacter sp.]